MTDSEQAAYFIDQAEQQLAGLRGALVAEVLQRWRLVLSGVLLALAGGAGVVWCYSVWQRRDAEMFLFLACLNAVSVVAVSWRLAGVLVEWTALVLAAWRLRRWIASMREHFGGAP